MFESNSETVFICNSKWGANFLPNKHGGLGEHAHEVPKTLEALLTCSNATQINL